MTVAIVDYAMSNLGSIRRAFEECGARVALAEEPGQLKAASRIVLPGVGAFADSIRHLEERGFIEPLREAARAGLPILGVCLGMQLLADAGEEGGERAGLALIPGRVRRLEPDQPRTRIPHVGWNEVRHGNGHRLWRGVADGADFYFVHSYHFLPDQEGDVVARTPYCGSFVSALARGNVVGVQFHPEKSGRPGFQFLANFLRL